MWSQPARVRVQSHIAADLASLHALVINLTGLSGRYLSGVAAESKQHTFCAHMAIMTMSCSCATRSFLGVIQASQAWLELLSMNPVVTENAQTLFCVLYNMVACIQVSASMNSYCIQVSASMNLYCIQASASMNSYCIQVSASMNPYCIQASASINPRRRACQQQKFYFA